MYVLALSITTARRIGEIGFAIGALGALLLVAGTMLRGGPEAARRSVPIMAAGFLLVGVAFVLGIVELHWG